jgi:hypothetical protein
MRGYAGVERMSYSADSHKEIEQDFPNIIGKYEITSDKDSGHNCIAFAVGDHQSFWDPAAAMRPIRGYYWPPGCGDDDAIKNLVKVFQIHGYEVCQSSDLEADFEKVAIFGDAVAYSHAARQLPSGKWSSKLGEGHDIEHDTLDALCGTGNAYGKVIHLMKRRRAASAPVDPKS